ncbi:NUDIX hydrolase [Occultella glacieicola]|uniref:NUDIX hydrolase n=1 Tax=Occultella glacieicola TaxID=2518684 RepID=UPI001F2194E5|nr:NUDIX domain-containing protein [Occultella glacieicola]
MTDLGPEWHIGPDGRYFRRAARVLLFDDANRLLLVRGHDVDQPERTWWFTVGGGIDAGESARDAAVRELVEETGLSLRPDALIGPVLTRSAIFDFFARDVRQDEEFFMARIDAPGELSAAGWTQVEQDFMDEMRWWDLDALESVTVEIFPAQLVEITRELLEGWDGTVRHLGEVSE